MVSVWVQVTIFQGFQWKNLRRIMKKLIKKMKADETFQLFDDSEVAKIILKFFE